MNKTNQLFPGKGTVIILLVFLATVIVFAVSLKKEITKSHQIISELENELADLQYENEDLQNQLDDCLLERDHFESSSENEFSNNWNLQDEIEDLERKVEDLRGQLENCQDY